MFAKGESVGRRDTVPERRLGRPDAWGSEQLDRQILNTAARLFTGQGYASTSMEQIASEVGSGKQSIYRRYSSKEALFKAVIRAQVDNLHRLAEVAETGHDEPLVALREVCRALRDFANTKEVIAIYRILIAEADRFPGLIEFIHFEGEDSHEGTIRRLLRAAADAGQIGEGHSIDRLCRALIGLIVGWALNQALLGNPTVADAQERAAQFDTAWDIFLRGAKAEPKQIR